MLSSLILLLAVSLFYTQRLKTGEQMISALEGQSSDLSDENLILEEDMAKIQDRLPSILMNNMKTNKPDFWGDETNAFISRDLAITKRILLYAPRNMQALRKLCEIHLITLNFKEINEMSYPTKQTWVKFYRANAEIFPEYSFSEKKRPTLYQLMAFFEKNAVIPSPSSPQWLTRRKLAILKFDWENRSAAERAEYNKVILAFYKNISHDQDGLHLLYNEETLSLEIQSDLFLFKSWNSRALSYLRLRSLKITDGAAFPLSSLSGLDTSTLDLSSSPRIKVEHPFSIPSLETLILSPSAPSDEVIHETLKNELGTPIKIIRR